MAHEAAEAATAGSSAVPSMFDQALRALGDSLKVATKAQEDAVKFWSEAAGRAHPGHAAAGEWIPTAQKSAEEYLRLLESSYRRNAELLKKVMRSQSSAEGMDVPQRTSDYFAASMETVRANTQDLANTNMRVVQAWAEVFQAAKQQATQKATTK